MDNVAQQIADAPIELREPKLTTPEIADPWPSAPDKAALHGLPVAP